MPFLGTMPPGNELDSLTVVGLGRQEELHAEITKEIRLIAAGWFQAASGHEQKDHRTVEFVARSEIEGADIRKDENCIVNRTPCPLRVSC